MFTDVLTFAFWAYSPHSGQPLFYLKPNSKTLFHDTALVRGYAPAVSGRNLMVALWGAHDTLIATEPCSFYPPGSRRYGECRYHYAHVDSRLFSQKAPNEWDFYPLAVIAQRAVENILETRLYGEAALLEDHLPAQLRH